MWTALRSWLRPRQPVDDDRWVVLDVEASGLDPTCDRLLAIAAVGVHRHAGRMRIALADSFEVVLRQPRERRAPDKSNILLHGIGVGAQDDGVEPRAALAAFTRFIARSPLLGFHVGFDRMLIERGFAAQQQRWPGNPWLDLEPLAAVLHPQVNAHALDEWMAHFHIRCAKRHQAAADALATAELLLHLWPQLKAQARAADFRATQTLAAQRRWLRA